ncbi:hypothetical protein Tco_0343222 [Tanacetum coccineum]
MGKDIEFAMVNSMTRQHLPERSKNPREGAVARREAVYKDIRNEWMSLEVYKPLMKSPKAEIRNRNLGSRARPPIWKRRMKRREFSQGNAEETPVRADTSIHTSVPAFRENQYQNNATCKTYTLDNDGNVSIGEGRIRYRKVYEIDDTVRG